MKSVISLKKRYFSKIFSNFWGLLIGILVMGIFPRKLGPLAYGNFSFITQNILNFFSFFNLSFSNCLFIKLSKDNNRHEPISFMFLYFATVIFFLSGLAIVVVFAIKMNSRIWPDITISLIGLAYIWNIMNWYSSNLTALTDALALTVQTEIIKMIQKMFSLILVGTMLFFNFFTIEYFFYYQYLLFGFLIFSILVVLRKKRVSVFSHLSSDRLILLMKEFFKYSSPLIFLSFLGSLGQFLDLWYLQFFSGSVQQGYFGFSFKIISIPLLIISPLIPVFTRDISSAIGSNRTEECVRLFERYFPFSRLLITYFLVFIACQSKFIILFVGGKSYLDASFTLIVLCISYIFYISSQMAAAILYAYEKTETIKNIQVPSILFGMCLGYFLISSEKFFGLDLGSLGLAIKTLITFFIMSSLNLYYSLKKLGLSFRRYFFQQFYFIAVTILPAYGAIFFIESFGLNGLISFLLSGFLYTLVLIVWGIKSPSMFYLQKEDIQKVSSVIVNFREKVLSF